jgi:hypothetical protein
MVDHRCSAPAGEAGTGIAQLLARYLELRQGVSREQALQRCFLMDSKGLVCKQRLDEGGLQPHKVPFAHDVPYCKTLEEAVQVPKRSRTRCARGCGQSRLIRAWGYCAVP